MQPNYTAETISMAAGVVLSLIFSYVPGAADAFNTLDGTQKRLLMLGLLVVAVAGFYFYDCGFSKAFACFAGANWTFYVRLFIQAAIANQAAYALSPRRPGRAATRQFPPIN